MDTVKLNYPVDVPKLVTGSDGFDISKDAAVGRICKEERVSVFVTAQKDLASSLNTSGSASSDKLLSAGSHGSSFHSSQVSERISFTNAGNLLSSLNSESKQRKGGRMSGSSNSCPKRPQMTHDPMVLDVVADGQIYSDQVGSYSNGSTTLGKTLVKQKSIISCKRGEKRNSKLSLKAKYDAFPLKTGPASFSAAGGNGFFGAYGLKTDAQDLTVLLDDLSLHDLLNGSYEVPRLCKDKERRTSSTNDSIMSTFRKACSVIHLPRPIQAQNSTDTSTPTDASVIDCNNGDSSMTRISSKDPCGMHVSLPENAICKSIHVLEQLSFPTPKDLESLLLDASKSVSRTTSDLRSGKQICRRSSLPPFPWSQTFYGHSKTNSDALKSPLSRVICQGRWEKVLNITNPLLSGTGFTNLETLTYDQSLVPSGEPIPDAFGSVSLPCFDGDALSLTDRSTSSEVHLVDSPIVLAAAQTLREISVLPRKDNIYGVDKWQKKPSQKVVKTPKSRSNEKHKHMFRTGIINQLKDVDQMSSKKPMMSMVEPNHIKCVEKGPLSLSASILCRSSPSEPSRDSIVEAKYSNMIRHSSMRPPPPRVLNKHKC